MLLKIKFWATLPLSTLINLRNGYSISETWSLYKLAWKVEEKWKETMQ